MSVQSATSVQHHYHVAYSLGSYSPDGSEGFPTATTMRELVDLVHDKLSQSAESARDLAVALAENEQYKEAWEANELALDLWNKAENWSNDRSSAPLYKDDPDAWNARIHRMLGDTFGDSVYGGSLPVGGGRDLNAWLCEASENSQSCEHLNTED